MRTLYRPQFYLDYESAREIFGVIHGAMNLSAIFGAGTN